jgi:hypothetical protein
MYNQFKKKKHFIFGISIVFLLFLIFDLFLELTNWGLIYKVLLFENSVTSRYQILNLVFPLISFEQNLGFSILAESQAGVFEPVKLFFNLAFGTINHINLTFFTRLVILYSSIYLLLKDGYKLSSETSLITSLFAVFSPIPWNDSVHQFHLGSIYLLPLLIYFVEKFLNSRNYLKYFVASSFVIFLQLLAGHFHYQLICLILLSIYALITILSLRPVNYKDIFFKFSIFFITLGFGFCLAAIQIIPTYELMLGGDRSNFNTTFQGSMSISGILIYYRTLVKIFNNVDGSLSTLGYIAILIYTLSQFLTSIKTKKFTYNSIYLKYALVFFLVYLLSLGQYFQLNNTIYKAIPFLESFRAPARFMLINSFCTLMLFAFAFEELKNKRFKIDNIKIIFIVVFIFYGLAFLHFSQYFHKRTDLDMGYWRHMVVVFYPFLIIIFSYIILKYEFKNKIKIIIILFVCISIIENISIMNGFTQYSLFFKKDLITNSVLKGEKLCKKHKTNSLNIVGEFKETEDDNYYNFKNFDYKSMLSSKNCKVFYHHNRTDIVKRGLGYSQSSLATYQMSNLSNYQYKFLEKNFDDLKENEFKYLASLLQHFTNAKVFYILDQSNDLKDDLFEFDSTLIEKFIKGYSFEKKSNIFDKLKKNEIIYNFIYKNSLMHNLFPSKSIKEFKLIKVNDYFLLPIWQDDNFYIKKNDEFFLLNDYSFGKKISLEDKDKKIYYMPISFIIGMLVTFLSLIILFVGFIITIYRR